MQCGWIRKIASVRGLSGYLHRGNTNGSRHGDWQHVRTIQITLLMRLMRYYRLGQVFLNEEYNSPENAAVYYGLLVACSGQNYSTYIGGYYSGQTGDPVYGERMLMAILPLAFHQAVGRGPG